MGLVRDVLEKWRLEYQWYQEKDPASDKYIMDRNWQIITKFIDFAEKGIEEDLSQVDTTFDE